MKLLDKIAPKWSLARAEAGLRLKTVRLLLNGSGYGHHGASYSKNAFSSWQFGSGNADDDIVDSIETLRERSRDLFMGSPLAAGAVKTIRTNVVGSGLMLVPKIDAAFLGMDEQRAQAWSESTLREWRMWAESANCDAEKAKDFYQIQSLVVLSALMSGDVFVSMPLGTATQSCPYTLKLYLIEADRVCNPYGSDYFPDKNTAGGVEIDEYGAPKAYWIASRNPNSQARQIKNSYVTWTRVPAFGAKTGRRNVLHVMADVERPAQRRGVPLLAPVIEALKQLQRYTQAELTAAVVTSMFTVFIKHNSIDTGGLGSGFMPGNEREENSKDYALGSGSIVSLATDESIETADPNRPNSNFEAFVEAVCRQLGSALEIPYELLIKNFTASYSASRASLLEAWKMFRMRRQWLVSSFCQPVYEEWLEEAILMGRIRAPGFFSDPAIRQAWCGADWYGDAQGQLDPLKEVSAAKIRIDESLSTRERETAELTGQTFKEVAVKRGSEQTLLKKLGLTNNSLQQGIDNDIGTDDTQSDSTDAE